MSDTPSIRSTTVGLTLAVLLWTVPGIAQCEIDKLVPVGAGGGDRMGSSLATDGDVLASGGPLHDDDLGAVWVYRRVGSSWTQEAMLTASDGEAGDRFGTSVDVDGDVLVVGALNDDDLGNQSGAAYVFRWNGTIWEEEEKLLADDGVGSDKFGTHVGIGGDAIIVGSPGDDDAGSFTGSAYVFRWDGVSWLQEQKLVPSDASSGDSLPSAISVSYPIVFLGASATDEFGNGSGSVYVYRYDGQSWVEEQELLPSTGDEFDNFGRSLDVNGDHAVIGAPGDNGSGSAYIFRNTGTTWVEVQTVAPADVETGDHFGMSTAIDWPFVVVGASEDDIPAGNVAGSAHLYRFFAGSWQHQYMMTASDAGLQDHFGQTAAINAGELLIGASIDDTTEGASSGSAFVFLGPALDCNGNCVADDVDIAMGTSLDSNGNDVPDECETFIRGDSNSDGLVNVSDPVNLLEVLFLSGVASCMMASDADAGGTIDLPDVFLLIDYLFLAGAPPSAPFPICDLDPSPSSLDCDDFACP